MSRAASFAIALVIVGCSPPAFRHDFRERAEPEITRVLRSLTEVPEPPAGPPVVIAARADASGLRAHSLEDGHVLWDVDADVRTAPVLAGPFVVVTEGDRIHGRRASDGALVFDAGPGMLLGAASDGERVVVSINEGPEQLRRGRLVMADASGVAWSHELQLPIGVAAIARDVVVVPWATQRLSFLRLDTGEERARLRFEDRVVGRAWVESGRVYVGQHDVVPVGPELEEPRSITRWQPLGRALPGQPALFPDGYGAVPTPDAAHHSVRLVLRVRHGDGTGAVDDALYLVFYRMLFALEAEADEPRWVHVHEADIVGARVVDGGIWIVDARGAATLLGAAHGATRAEVALGDAPMAAAAIRPPDGPVPEAEGEPTPLAAQLLAAARLDDNRLGGGSALAAGFLARTPGEEVTGELLDLCAEPATAAAVRVTACDALRTRTEGAAHLRRRLGNHGSFLADRPTPPAGPIAQAAASMQWRQGVPMLLRHLEDPRTPGPQLADLLDGLGRLGDPGAADSIETFVRLYHASDDPDLVRATVAGALAVDSLATRRGQALIEALRGDPFTPRQTIAQIDAALAERAEAQAAEAEPEPEAEAEPEPEVDERPERLDARITRQVFRAIHSELVACLDGERRMRISTVVDGDGQVSTVAVTPRSVLPCVEPLVRGLAFPETQFGLREQVVHTVRGPGRSD